MSFNFFKFSILCLFFYCFIICTYAEEQSPTPNKNTIIEQKVPETLLLESTTSIQRGVKFLLAQQQKEGCWKEDPAITALCTLAIMQSNAIRYKDKIAVAVQKARHYILSCVQPNGSITKQNQNANYSTAICLSTLAMLNQSEDYEIMRKARQFLLNSQNENGGFGDAQNEKQNSNLINTQLTIESLYLTDFLNFPESSENKKNQTNLNFLVQKTIHFINQCQNISESIEPTEKSTTINDGGFRSTPKDKKNKDESGSNGLMTYSGLKTMIILNVKKDDIRFQAALKWINKNYTVNENPGMGKQHYFYYLFTFAQTNVLLGDSSFDDHRGIKHNWKQDIIQKLLNMERNGSWINTESEIESVSEIGTAYALLSMEIALGNQLYEK